MKTSDFDYWLPQEKIAQTPIEPRHNSRLLILDRASSELRHTHFLEIEKFLNPGDVLVINQTRVIPARIFARKPTGGRVELLLLTSAMNEPGKPSSVGKESIPAFSLTLKMAPMQR